MTKIKQWFTANKVLFFGMLSAIAAIVTEYVSQPVIDYRVVAFGILGGIASYFAKNLRGQWASICGIFGSTIGLIITQITDHQPVTWRQLVLHAVVMFIAIIAPPAKSVEYERSAVVQEAKIEAKEIDEVKNKAVPVGK